MNFAHHRQRNHDILQICVSWSAVGTSWECWRLPAFLSTHLLCSEGFSLLFYFRGNWGWERWCDLSQVTQLLVAQTIWTQVCRTPRVTVGSLAASLEGRAEGRSQVASDRSQRRGPQGCPDFTMASPWPCHRSPSLCLLKRFEDQLFLLTALLKNI